VAWELDTGYRDHKHGYRALLKLEPPCGPVFPTLCGGRVALLLSRHASSLLPVDYMLTPHGFYHLKELQEAGKMLRMRGWWGTSNSPLLC
jgi:hypothetical protein